MLLLSDEVRCLDAGNGYGLYLDRDGPYAAILLSTTLIKTSETMESEVSPISQVRNSSLSAECIKHNSIGIKKTVIEE